MKNWLTRTLLIVVLMIPSVTFSQTAADLTLARQLVTLQHGDELKSLWNNIANATALASVEKWQNIAFDSVAESKREQVANKLDAELGKLHAAILQLIEKESNAVEKEELARFYAKNFTTQELQTMIAWFDSPTFKKYQAMNPQIAKAYMDALMARTNDKIEQLQSSFDKNAQAIIDAAK